ncbi:unnamed protein product [Cuscuta epithymum]|uniref:Uncharacterized protein n=1 Tax=Cuscuta epithymum TaxID=186058 RepID=A0AAV0D0K7_9ASTE|nr:unnamed protein product [Cuscuta epithymum]
MACGFKLTVTSLFLWPTLMLIGQVVRTTVVPPLVMPFFWSQSYFLPSWRSKKQPTISKSYTEAEYRAIAYTIQDNIFIRSLISEMGIQLSTPVQLHYDNVSAS